MKPLSKTPNEIVEIRDDADAQALLLQLGVVEKFPKSPALSEPWAAGVGYAEHPTHWILGIRFTGFPNAIDNGYVVFCVPKSRYALPAANAWLSANTRHLFPSGLDIERYEPLRPPQS